MPPAVRPRARAFVLVTLLAALLGSSLPATAQERPFELAFCAPTGAWPMSSRDRPGFDNAIAEILADELGATATFVWTNFDAVGIRDSLHAGRCDVAIGVGEGVANVLSTVPYLQTPFVFVERSDRALGIESLDDPRLAEVTIGTYQAGIPSIALRNRGINDNVREFAALVRPTGQDDHTPILDAVLAGEVDVGIVYGPVAAARALEEGGALTIRPVTPELDFGATILQLSRIWTIGVRTFDEALRDRLNRVLAARWDDVVAVLDAYGVPQSPLSRPRDLQENPAARKVGVIVPAGTPASLANAPVGDAARLGARVAENAVALRATPDAPFVVLTAHAPTLESVERAALRLIRVEGVDALVGGYDGAEAALLARIAAEHGVAFFNVGAEDAALRDRACFPTTLHVAPSGPMLAAGTAEVFAASGAARVFAVAERGPTMEPLLDDLAGALAARGSALVGSALVEPGSFIFFPTFEPIRASGADTVVLLLDPDAQEMFLGQVASMGLGVRVTGLSTVRGQSRPYLQRYLQVAPELGGAARVVVWDAALPVPVNEAFAARTSEPMEPAAWTTYAAVLAAFEAARAGTLDDIDALWGFLTAEATALDLGKQTPVRFRPADGQMLQELYVAEAVPDAVWGRTAAARIAVGRVAAVLPVGATAEAGLPVDAGCTAP